MPQDNTLVRAFTAQQPKEPPKEIMEMTFTSDDPVITREAGEVAVTIEDKSGKVTALPTDSLPPLSKEEGEVKVDSTKEEEVKQEEVKQEEKKEETKKDVKDYIKPPPSKEKGQEKKPEGEKKEVITKIAPVARGQEQFDYTGFSPAETDYLKNMSRPAREYTSALIKEKKELEKLKDASYLQHPDAYLLNPEYKDVQRNITFAQKEAEFYADQLEQIKLGKPFKALKSWDEKGNPVTTAEIVPTNKSEEMVRLAMNNCYSTAQQLQGKIAEYPTRFKSQVENDSRAIQQERQNRFAWVADPSLLDSVVSVEGLGDVPIKQVKQQMSDLFPPYLRQHPAVDIVGDMMVAFHIQSAMLKDAQQSSTLNAIKVQEVKRGEPSSSVKPSTQSSNEDSKWGVKEFDLGGMPT